jgi:hypothetical protein
LIVAGHFRFGAKRRIEPSRERTNVTFSACVRASPLRARRVHLWRCDWSGSASHSPVPVWPCVAFQLSLRNFDFNPS